MGRTTNPVIRDRAGESGPPPQRDEPAGFGAREVAVTTISSVIARGRALDDAFEHALAACSAQLEARDRAFARLIALTVLRRRGELDQVLTSFLEKPLPAKCGRLWPILLAGAAQVLMLRTPAHAAISLAVEQTRRDRDAGRFDRLANAVLRRAAREGAALLATLDGPRLNVPGWLYARWTHAYGEEKTHRIAEASLRDAALDLTVKSDTEVWARRLGASVLPTGSLRLQPSGPIEELPGYDDGAWWVQDAAAALPARLLGDVSGLEVADLCAAPGGKTAQLAAKGARVTAVDLSPERLRRLESNLRRLKLNATHVEADVAKWSPQQMFDAVLLDAPCTATGTVRRHPDILHLKRESDIAQAAELQARLLASAARLVRPGGLLVFCTCSLEPEEGAFQVTRFLMEHANFKRLGIAPHEIGADPDWVSPEGDLQTFPFHLADARPGMSGIDGFYAARLTRTA